MPAFPIQFYEVGARGPALLPCRGGGGCAHPRPAPTGCAEGVPLPRAVVWLPPDSSYGFTDVNASQKGPALCSQLLFELVCFLLLCDLQKGTKL